MPIYAVLIVTLIVLGTLAVIALGIWWKFGAAGLLILGLVLAYGLISALVEGLLTAPLEYLLNRSAKPKPDDPAPLCDEQNAEKQ